MLWQASRYEHAIWHGHMCNVTPLKNIQCRLGHPKFIGNDNTTYTIKQWRKICFCLLQFMGDKGPCKFIPSDRSNICINVSDHPAECPPFHQRQSCVGVCHHHHHMILMLHLMRMIRTINPPPYKIILHWTGARWLTIFIFWSDRGVSTHPPR